MYFRPRHRYVSRRHR